MARKPVKLQKEIQQDALGKVNIVKEIRRRGKDGLKINQHHFVRKKVSRQCELKGRICEISLEQRGGSSYGLEREGEE